MSSAELSAFVGARSLAFCALGATEKFSGSSDMPHHYDAIIIGAGHYGLTCACYLARAGLKVLLHEQYHTVGGMMAAGRNATQVISGDLGLDFTPAISSF